MTQGPRPGIWWLLVKSGHWEAPGCPHPRPQAAAPGARPGPPRPEREKAEIFPPGEARASRSGAGLAPERTAGSAPFGDDEGRPPGRVRPRRGPRRRRRRAGLPCLPFPEGPGGNDSAGAGAGAEGGAVPRVTRPVTVEAAAQTLPRPPGAWDSPDAPRPPPRRPPGPGPGPGAGAGAGGGRAGTPSGWPRGRARRGRAGRRGALRGRAGSPGLGDRKLCGVNGKKWVVRALRLPLTSLPK